MILDFHTHNQQATEAIISVMPQEFDPQQGKRYSVCIHPWRSQQVTPAMLDALHTAVRHPQVAAIGDSLMCTHRTVPFSEDGSSVRYDQRTPNIGLLRLQYASIAGHTTLFRRELLDLLPDVSHTYYGTVYDVILAITAAAYCPLVLIDEPLVHQRRYTTAASYTGVDSHRIPGYYNGLYIIGWSLTHFRQVKPLMVKHFKTRASLLDSIHANTKSYHEAVKMLRLQSSASLWSLLRLQQFFIRHRSEIFYTKGKDPQNFIRAFLFPVMQVYNYKYLLQA
jgi:hypothetical protein